MNIYQPNMREIKKDPILAKEYATLIKQTEEFYLTLAKRMTETGTFKNEEIRDVILQCHSLIRLAVWSTICDRYPLSFTNGYEINAK